MDEDALVIRSVRSVFELERRIHKIDRYRIPLPYGLPLRSLGFGAACLLAVLVLGAVPVLGPALDRLPPPMRLVLLPVFAAYALGRVRVDGRPLHSALGSLARFAVGPRRLVGFRTGGATSEGLGDVVMAPDERVSRYRAGRVQGPAELLLRYPAQARQRGGKLTVRQAGAAPLWRGKRILVRADQRVEFR
jgi:hypothetical protein